MKPCKWHYSDIHFLQKDSVERKTQKIHLEATII